MDNQYLSILRAQKGPHVQTNSNMIYGHSAEFNLNRAVDFIKSAQLQFKQELDAKDVQIHSLEMQHGLLQNENLRLSEKENSCYKDLVAGNQFLEQRLSTEQSKNEELQAELARTKQELSIYKERTMLLENEKKKADHIIKTLLKKYNNVNLDKS